jgi:PAS domain S-box-containing protein
MNIGMDIFDVAPMGFAQIKIEEKPGNDSPLYEFITVNRAFESITGLKREFLLEQHFSGLPISFTNGEIIVVVDEGKLLLMESSRKLIYYSKITRQLYLLECWISDEAYLNCFFIVNRSSQPEQDVYRLRSIEYDAVIEELHDTNAMLQSAMINIEKQSEEQHLILDSISDMVTYLDPGLRVVWGNKAAMKSMGRDFEDMVGQACYKVFNNGDTVCKNCPVEKALISHKPESAVIEREDGSIWDLLFTPVFDIYGNLEGIVETAKDITSQKNIEMALRESEEKLSTTLYSIGDGVISTDIFGHVEAMNPVAEKLCGWRLSEIKGKPLQDIFKIINADSRLIVENPVEKVLECGQVVGLANHTVLISRDGSERQISDSAAPIKNRQGEMQGVVLVFSDVTESYAIQKRIRESEEKFRLLVTQMEQGLAVHEAVYNDDGKMVDYRFIEMNANFEKLTGLSREKILGKTVLDVLPETESYWIEKYSTVVETGKSLKYDNYSKEFDKFFEIVAYRNREHQFATMITDITKRKQFEDKIKTSDKVFTHSIDMLCVAGFDGYFKVLNPSWEKVLGWSEQELLDKPWIDFVHPEDVPSTTQIKSVIDNGIEIYQFENRYICKDGSVKWLSWNTFPYPEDNIMFGVARDITIQKQVEQTLRLNEEKYRLVFEKSPAGILHYDKNGLVTICNDKFASIIGAPKHRIVGLDLMKLPDKRIVGIFEDSLAGKSSGFEGHYTSVLGKKTTPVRIVTTPVYAVDGSPDGGIAVVEDQTELIQKQALEKKVAIAQDSVKFKQQFLANMSHEIRTPLTGILGMVEIMEQTDLSETQLDYLVTLKHSGENLKEIINLILDFSKIEAGKVQLRKNAFEFAKLFPIARNLFQSICNKPIAFETNIDPAIPIYIIADESRILQILNNLVSNAVKFTEKGKITISAELIKRRSKNQYIKISVTDTGIGVPFENQQFLFTPFTQLDHSNSRTFEGTGLGLSICKELAKLHGGEIGMHSSNVGGSTFWFTFATCRAPQNMKEKEIVHHKGVGTKVKRILVAEDKIVNQKVFRIMLSSLGHEVTIVDNGKQLLDIYKPGLFDIIFMDIQMPEMDGLTATHLLKEKYTGFIPIVGLSANAFEGDKEKYMELGMDEYLMKPVKREDFSGILEKFFECESEENVN